MKCLFAIISTFALSLSAAESAVVRQIAELPAYFEELSDAPTAAREYWVPNVSAHPRFIRNHLQLTDSFVGALHNIEFGDGNALAEPSRPTAFQVRRYLGVEANWHPAAGAWHALRYRNVYRGVDVTWTTPTHSGNNVDLQLQVAIEPGIAPATFSLALGGDHQTLRVDPQSGELILGLTPFFALGVRRPMAWQQVGGTRRDLTATWVVGEDFRARVAVDGADANHAIFVDTAVRMTRSASTNVRILNWPSNETWIAATIPDPATCGFIANTRISCQSILVRKIDAHGETTYATWLAGSSDELLLDMKRQGEREVVVLGNSTSRDYPVTANALQRVNSGPFGSRIDFSGIPKGDLFLSVLDAATGLLRHSTFLGIEGAGETGSILTAPKGVAVYIQNAGIGMFPASGGWRSQSDCPPSDTRCRSNAIARISPALDRLTGFTYLTRDARAMLLLRDDEVAVAFDISASNAPSYPVSAGGGPFGGSDIYLLRLSADLRSLRWGRILGSPADDRLGGFSERLSGELLVLNLSSAEIIRVAAADGQSIGRIPYDGPPLRSASIGEMSNSRVFVAGLTSNTVTATCRGAAAGSLYLWQAGGGFNAVLPIRTDPDGVGVSFTEGRLEAYNPSWNRLLTLELDAEPTTGIWCVSGGGNGVETYAVPGKLVTIFGEKVGPSARIDATLTAAGSLPTQLGGVEVTLNNAPVPLLSVQSGEVRAVLPFTEIGPRADLTLRFAGATARYQTIGLTTSAEWFLRDPLQSNDVLAVNIDGSLNRVSNGARPGDVVTLWATGLGLMLPNVQAGRVADVRGPYPRPAAPVNVFIERLQAEVLYAGTAPGLLHGIVQVNLRIPPLAPGSYDIIFSPQQIGSTPAKIWIR
jgi:uncharacterized protein (TIGR03437 family)